jgi:hypothetical protein
MEWIHQNWQLVSFVLAHVGYLIQSEVKKAMHIDQMEKHMESTDKRIERLEFVLEKGLSASCQVHTNQIQHIEKRLDKLEVTR